MEQKALYKPFELCVSDLESWRARPLIYHFFEIVRIMDGEGMREVNENRYTYKKGSIFLFTPLDCRGFEAIHPTRFCSIRFSEVFLAQYRNAEEHERIRQRLKHLELIFFHHNRFHELLIKNPGDCQMISSLINNMIEEYEQKQAYHEENLQYLVTLVLNILARNVTNHVDKPAPAQELEPLINKMLVHIHQHIREPNKLRIDYLASQFHLSSNYIGEYFKKFTGESLQRYVTQYKMKLVQQRLEHSPLTISQIADEVGFTDESHLGRLFKKHTGMSPKEYRKNTTPTSRSV